MDFPQEVKDERQSKMMAEVYLTRLLRTKVSAFFTAFAQLIGTCSIGIHKEISTVHVSRYHSTLSRVVFLVASRL